MMREVQERQEMLKAEAKLRKRQKSFSETEPEDEYLYGNRRASVSQRQVSVKMYPTEISFNSNLYRKHHNSGPEHNDDASCDHKGTFLLDFGGRSVQRGQCLSKCLHFYYVMLIYIITE